MNTHDILYYITIAGKAEDLVETTRGQVSYLDWLKSEKRRIETKSGWPVEVVRNPMTGEVALAHLRLR